MELRRFYVRPEDIEGDVITVSGNEYRHMTGVLRFKVGYQAIVCDNTGIDYWAIVEHIDKSAATLRIIERKKNNAELPYTLRLCCGLIKGEKLEIEVQKAVEIGVHQIQPFISRYTAEQDVRQDRLERIVLEACKQCGRAVLPRVMPIARFEDIFESNARYYMAYEKEDKHLLRDVVAKPHSQETVALVIGSEGGFSPEEVQMALSAGATTFSLGKRILRAETAAIVALGTFSALTEEL